jgi:hypothetical protein
MIDPTLTAVEIVACAALMAQVPGKRSTYRLLTGQDGAGFMGIK